MQAAQEGMLNTSTIQLLQKHMGKSLENNSEVVKKHLFHLKIKKNKKKQESELFKSTHIQTQGYGFCNFLFFPLHLMAFFFLIIWVMGYLYLANISNIVT